MKLKTISLEPGAIVVWKEYSLLKRLWYKIRHKQLPWNKFYTITKPTTLLSFKTTPISNVYEPNKKYSQKEAKRFHIFTSGGVYTRNWITVADAINMVRSSTVDKTKCNLDNCRYYKKVNLDERTTKHICEIIR